MRLVDLLDEAVARMTVSGGRFDSSGRYACRSLSINDVVVLVRGLVVVLNHRLHRRIWAESPPSLPPDGGMGPDCPSPPLDCPQTSLEARVAEGKAGVTAEEVPRAAAALGYGAVKYADLRQHPSTDYQFSYDRWVWMVAVMRLDRGKRVVCLRPPPTHDHGAPFH